MEILSRNNQNYYRALLFLVLSLFSVHIATAQISANSTYSFLSLTQSSRATALGGGVISIKDGDVSLAYANPALINQQMHGRLSFNHNFHYADIQHGFVNYGFSIPKLGLNFHSGINYINYGDFTRTDLIGNELGQFSASEVALTIGASKQLDERISAGINLKMANSTLDSYSSFGIVGDFGLLYENVDDRFSIGLVLKNAGLMITKYDQYNEATPIDLQLAFSKRLEHLPLRFTIMGQKLQQWDLRFESQFDDQSSGLFGEVPSEASLLSKSVDNFFRHIVFNAEFLLGKNESFKLRFGYNHLRRKEQQLSQFRSLAGFSMGLGFDIRKMSFDYGIGYYHLAGAVNHLGIAIKLREFQKTL